MKSSTAKSELEADIRKSRSETVSVQDALLQMKIISDGLSQDKIDLGRIIKQVHHFLSPFTVVYLHYICFIKDSFTLKR